MADILSQEEIDALLGVVDEPDYQTVEKSAKSLRTKLPPATKLKNEDLVKEIERSVRIGETKNPHVCLIVSFYEISEDDKKQIIYNSEDYRQFVECTNTRMFIFDDNLNHRMQEISEPLPEELKIEFEKVFFKLSKFSLKKFEFDGFRDTRLEILTKKFFFNYRIIGISVMTDIEIANRISNWNYQLKNDAFKLSDLKEILGCSQIDADELFRKPFQTRLEEINKSYDECKNKFSDYDFLSDVVEKHYEEAMNKNSLDSIFPSNFKSKYNVQFYDNLISKLGSDFDKKELDEYKLGMNKVYFDTVVDEVKARITGLILEHYKYLNLEGPIIFWQDQMFAKYYPEKIL